MEDVKKLFNREDVIFVYSRSEAFIDGILVDVSKIAGEAGFRLPVALTQALWADIHEIPEHAQGQDAKGRLWDVLSMGVQTIRDHKRAGGVPSDTLFYSLFLPVGNRTMYRVKMVCGPGDEGEPVMTLMRPGED